MDNAMTATQAAKAARSALKAAFAGVTFSVRSATHTTMDTVRISWVDGPSAAAVQAAVAFIHDDMRYVSCRRRASEVA